jgi:CheY-like chemotaxis protein
MRNLILIVEDETLVRMLAVDVAQDAGFEPLEAASADEALLLLDAHPDIRILMTDIDMPGSMNGLRLAAISRERWPAVEIVVVSGMRRPDGGDLRVGCAFYSKPYDIAEITEQFRRMAGLQPQASA